MRRRAVWALLLAPLLLAAAADPIDDALRTLRSAELRSHVAFLSHDLLRGRAPGTRGAATAAHYIATQFAQSEVQAPPAGYVQPVPLVGTTPRPDSSVLEFGSRDDGIAARYGTDAIIWPAADRSATARGELVFVGYGIRAPEYEWDDYGEVDLEGRVALILVNDPPAPPEEPDLFDGRAMTWYGRWTYKLEEVRRRGAAGALLVHTEPSAGYPWSVVAASWSGEQLRLARPPAGELEFEGWLSHAFTRDVLALAGLELPELMVLAARRDFQPIPTGIVVDAHAVASTRRFSSSNVIGMIPGSDQRLRNEAVLYVAHYDHLGTRPSEDGGDSIFNGAYDNASGVAAMLEVAEAFAAMEPRPRRTIVFLATTAEEAGLLGAEFYVANPLVPLARTVAVVNIDGANLWGETEDAGGLGAERSTLGGVLEAQAASMRIEIADERAPEKGFFFRSDHFPFARAGVPALQLEHGTRFRGRPAEWGDDLLRRYEAERYHQPDDELDGEMSFEGMVQQAALALRVGYAVAQADERPEWLEGGRVMGRR